MSTLVSQPNSAISWKQEVSRRIAAHQSRDLSAPKPAVTAQRRLAVSSRCAQAVARVVARYAQAPSYSQAQVSEAHKAQPVAQAVLPDSQKAPGGPRIWEPVLPQALAPVQPIVRRTAPTIVPAQPAVPSSLEAWESEYPRLGWEPDFISRFSDEAGGRKPISAKNIASRAEDNRAWLAPAEEPSSVEAIEPVEPDQPIHANLIEFPRELIATRKRRPRRAEGPLVAERQLSIFEVDPVTRPLQPAAVDAAPFWPRPEWSSVELDAQPIDDPEFHDRPTSQMAMQLAPIGRRLTAALVDGALIGGAITGAAIVAAANIARPLPAKIAEISVVSALLLAGVLYHAIFLALAEATPGMKCAGISLCTFDGQSPTSAQSRLRLGALLLSVIPLGMGVAWALFDDDHLCWHDRLSKTYLRER
ncbi:MAG: RDD family protein [Terracidiphilus sp.]